LFANFTQNHLDFTSKEMLMRRKILPLIARLALSALLATASSRAQAPAADTGDSLPALVAEALQNNPGIKAAEFRVKSLQASPSRAWYLDAPQVGVEFYEAPLNSFPNPLKNQTEIDYSVQQSFPFPGKISSRIRAGKKQAEMGEANVAALKRKVVREIKTDYYELYLLDRRMEINRRNQALMTRLIEIARRQYEVGLGRQADILRAQTELTNLKTDSITLAQTRRATEGMLNAWLNRKTARPLTVTDTLTPDDLPWSLEAVQGVLETNHPELQAMKASVQMREAERTMAKREFWPDFTIGGSYKDMVRIPEGSHLAVLQDYWSVSASMSIPLALWSLPKYRAGILQSRADRDQAEAEYADTRNLLFARAQAALLKAQSSAELVRLSRTVLLPQAQQALESTLSAYQGGKSEFMTLLDAYRMSLVAKENSEMALMQLLSSQAELEEAVGLSLEEIQKKISEGAGK
jgi:outer membrane protein TolC